MSKKITTSFNVEKAVTAGISKPSVFDRIIKEIEAREIPVIYIEQILVQYLDGNIVELSKDELINPLPLNKRINRENLEESFKKMKDIKILLNTEKLEIDINEMVEEILGKYC